MIRAALERRVGATGAASGSQRLFQLGPLANFPLYDGVETRWGFVGEPADEKTARNYLQKRVPEVYRTKGAANPVRFIQSLPTTGA